MKYSDFGLCRPRSELVLQRVKAKGYSGLVVYGLFFPDTSPDTWDERWAAQAGSGFTHFWIETTDRIFDCSLRQFGGPSKLWTNLSDPRYVRAGFINSTGNLINYPDSKVKIFWHTLCGNGFGGQKVEVVMP